MPFNNDNSNEPIGVKGNPLIKTVFFRTFDEPGVPVPPSGSYIINETGDEVFIITETGDRMITE